MRVRNRSWGMALLAAGALWPVSSGLAQDPVDVDPLPPAPRIQADPPLSIEERVLRKNRERLKNNKVEDGDLFKKHPPVWSLRDVTKDVHPYASPSTPAPGVGRFPGGPNGQFGYPYYYTPTGPDTSGFGGAAAGGPMPIGGMGYAGGPALDLGSYPTTGGYSNYGYGHDSPGYNAAVDPALGYDGLNHGGGYASGPVGSMYGGGYGYGYVNGYGGLPNYAAQPGMLPGNPYLYHFGPGYYRNQEAGHYQFPYYSYRRPWYFPGHPSYNRDTNIPW